MQVLIQISYYYREFTHVITRTTSKSRVEITELIRQLSPLTACDRCLRTMITVVYAAVNQVDLHCFILIDKRLSIDVDKGKFLGR